MGTVTPPTNPQAPPIMSPAVITRLTPLARSRLISGACTICTAMLRSGVRIGSAFTAAVHYWTLKVRLLVTSVSFAAEVGWTIRTRCARHFVTLQSLSMSAVCMGSALCWLRRIELGKRP